MKKYPLIGHAGELADLLSLSIGRKDRHKILFAGPPGCGKTTVAERIAEQLCGTKFAVESINGRHVTIHVVREWMHDLACSSLFGTGWKVKVINEVDLCQKDAQDALLTLLDDLPAQRAIIGTSNLDLKALTERFRTRFTRYEVRAPEDAAVAGLLEYQEGLPPAVAKHIAALACGNVRAAILDADAWRNSNPVPRAKPVLAQTTLAALGL